MSITLNTVVYTFRGFAGRIANFMNSSTGVPQSFKRVTCVVDEPTDGKNWKVRWKLKLPVVVDGTATSPGLSTLAYEDIADIVLTVPTLATTASRTDLALSVKDLCTSPDFQASIISLLTPSA